MNGLFKPEEPPRAPAIGSAMFEGFCRMFFTCYCSLTVEGRQHLPSGPFLLCSNHTSHADSAALMTASGRSFRELALLGASDYFFETRRVHWVVSPLMNVIPIERRPGAHSLSGSLEKCRRFLEETGGGLILYPEGTRSPDGEMQEFKSGAGLFCSELGVPLVPAYVKGTHRVLPKGQSVPRPGHVTVRFGHPLTWTARPSSREGIRNWRREVVEQLSENIRLLSLGDRDQELVV
jgi:1-acyl-sn-glycerol-3-phosphate acyltransferase